MENASLYIYINEFYGKVYTFSGVYLAASLFILGTLRL